MKTNPTFLSVLTLTLLSGVTSLWVASQPHPTAAQTNLSQATTEIFLLGSKTLYTIGRRSTQRNGDHKLRSGRPCPMSSN